MGWNVGLGAPPTRVRQPQRSRCALATSLIAATAVLLSPGAHPGSIPCCASAANAAAAPPPVPSTSTNPFFTLTYKELARFGTSLERLTRYMPLPLPSTSIHVHTI
jgi:hypothetical protein